MKNGISRKSFDGLLDSARKKTLKKSVMGTEAMMDSAFEITRDVLVEASTSREVQNTESIQSDIRTAFNKTGLNHSPIGTHPDFAHLAETDLQEKHHICSLFLDIKNSTRLSFIYELEDVVAIKNTILKAAAETVRAMDGHVHRFMGDALLAFFGGKQKDKDDSIINAINCASVLESLMTGTIIPALEDNGFKASYLGFRIGLDFGPDEKVLWASYGLRGVYEVTATSFHVDVAAKLQNMAGRNKAMFGESIMSEIDFPAAYQRTKTYSEGGETKQIYNLDKTYTDAEGQEFTYKVRELVHESYRDLLPYSTNLKETFTNSKTLSCPGIIFSCYCIEAGVENEYRSVSRTLAKGIPLKFKIQLLRTVYDQQDFPLSVTFTKTNHGKEAESNKDSGEFQKPVTKIVRDLGFHTQFFAGKTIEEPESTSYRGLHTMEVTIKDSNQRPIFRDIIGVYIK